MAAPRHWNSWGRTVQVRAGGTSFDKSAFPQAFTHTWKGTKEEFSFKVMCQCAACSPQHALGWKVLQQPCRLCWLVKSIPPWWGPHHPLPTQHTEGINWEKQKNSHFKLWKQTKWPELTCFHTETHYLCSVHLVSVPHYGSTFNTVLLVIQYVLK